jgi:hypothetical protein
LRFYGVGRAACRLTFGGSKRFKYLEKLNREGFRSY